MEILCNFEKLMSPSETFRDDSQGPKESPQKNLGPKARAKQPGGFFLAFALCNFQSENNKNAIMTSKMNILVNLKSL